MSHLPRIASTAFDLFRTATSELANGFTQVAFVVPDIRRASRELCSTFGIAGFFIMENAPVVDETFEGEPTRIGVHIAFGFLQAVNVELIEPLADSRPNIYQPFLDAHRGGGLHHIGFRVYDFDGEAAVLAKRFGPAVQTGRFGKATRYAYFDSRPLLNVYTEIFFYDSDAERLFAKIRAGAPPATLD